MTDVSGVNDNVGMANTPMVTVAARVHPALRDRLLNEAKRTKRSPGFIIRGLLEDTYHFDPDDVGNSNDNDTDSILLVSDH